MSVKTVATRIEADDYGVGRHWSPQSEKYAGVDALIGVLDNGWRVEGVVFRQEHWYDRARRVSLYHVRLGREDADQITMIIVDNPYLHHVLESLKVQIVQLNERKQTTVERW